MNIRKRLLSSALALCMLFGSASMLPQDFADDTIKASAASQAELYLPAGGAEPIGIYEIDEPVAESHIDSSLSGVKSDISVSDSLFRRTTSHYIYSCLSKYKNGDKMQKLYDEILEKMEELWYYKEDIPEQHKYSSDQFKYYFCFDYAKYDLTEAEAATLVNFFYDANPMMFFIEKGLWKGHDGTIGVIVKDQFVSKDERTKWNSMLLDYIKSYETVLEGKKMLYQKALAIHDYLIRNTYYAFIEGTHTPQKEKWAHNIMGIVEFGAAVCEGYSRMYSLLVNYYGGNCMYAAGNTTNGGSHAWNVVQLDNGKYYYVDTTWDDPVVTFTSSDDELVHTYFAVGTDKFYSSHIPMEGYYTALIQDKTVFQYILPPIPKENFDKSSAVHKHSFTNKVTKPTCISRGYTTHTCEGCGYSYRDGFTEFSEHKFVVQQKIVEPTCTDGGAENVKCSVCGMSYLRTTEKLGHDYKATVVKPTCTAKGYTLHKCTRCRDSYKDTYKAALGHKWSKWTTTGFNFSKNTSTQTRKCSVCGKTETQTNKNAIERLAGANRYETASIISKKMNPKTSGTVIIATGLTFHDAMVAVPLASAHNAPLLLATERHITAQTEAELKRLKAKKVIVVSTNGAIGSGAKAELKALGLKATYIEGKNVFETSTRVAKALQTQNKKAPDTIFFATDGAFADALSASPVAAIKGAPIIYLNNKSIDKATADYLKSVKGKIKNAYIIGGDGVISNAMMKNVAKVLGLTSGKTVQRVAGANRYETCVAVNKKFKSVLNSDGICVAKGLDFPDALAGGVYAAATKQALFLADGKKLQDCQNTYLKGKNAAKITVFGGTGAVPDSLVKLIAKASV